MAFIEAISFPLNPINSQTHHFPFDHPFDHALSSAACQKVSGVISRIVKNTTHHGGQRLPVQPQQYSGLDRINLKEKFQSYNYEE